LVSAPPVVVALTLAVPENTTTVLADKVKLV